MKLSSTLGGLAGAFALTLLNEGVKRINKNAPRLDLLGQNALAKLMKGKDLMPQTAQKVFPLAGDIMTNSLYYGMAKGGSSKDTLIRGTLLGLGAGIAAVTLPGQLELDERPTNLTNQTKLMTVAWYLLGGLVAAGVINALDGSKSSVKNNAPFPESNELKGTLLKTGKHVGKEIAQTV